MEEQSDDMKPLIENSVSDSPIWGDLRAVNELNARHERAEPSFATESGIKMQLGMIGVGKNGRKYGATLDAWRTRMRCV